MLINKFARLPTLFKSFLDRMTCAGVDEGAASVRMLLALAVLLYLWVQHLYQANLAYEERSIEYMALVYFIYAFLQWLSNLIWPGPIFSRRVISILTDVGIVTYALIAAGETAAPFVGGYLWVTIANGLRFGRSYLIATNIFCVLGFALVMCFSQYWKSQMVLGVGLMIWLILLPGYVTALLKRLEVALHRANLANKTKSDFLANMSHELRTPLNAIIGYSEMLQEDAELEGSVQAVDDLGKIQRSANHLLGLINGVLDLSKIESGKMCVTSECFDIRVFFEDALAGMQPLFEKRGNLCEVEFKLEQYQVNTDKLKLKQIIINLLGNANKFTEKGLIQIKVTHLGDKNNSELTIQVHDNGIGIAQDKLARVFEPFVQGDTSSTRKYEGTGLGLTITKRFVEMLDGKIDVSSQEHVGSIFTVTIPQRQTLCPVYSENVCELESPVKASRINLKKVLG